MEYLVYHHNYKLEDYLDFLYLMMLLDNLCNFDFLGLNHLVDLLLHHYFYYPLLLFYYHLMNLMIMEYLLYLTLMGKKALFDLHNLNNQKHHHIYVYYKLYYHLLNHYHQLCIFLFYHKIQMSNINFHNLFFLYLCDKIRNMIILLLQKILDNLSYYLNKYFLYKHYFHILLLSQIDFYYLY